MGALAGVSGLTATSSDLYATSDNINNSRTNAYKANFITFGTLVTGQSAGRYAPGSVRPITIRQIDRNMTPQPTSSATDVAIEGDGFLIMSKNTDAVASDLAYTRLGLLVRDKDGYLKSPVSGYYLRGWQLDSAGNPINSDGTPANETVLSATRPINVNKINGISRPTQNVSLQVTLPSEENTFGAASARKVRVPVIDSLGARRDLTFEFQRIGSANPLRWQVTITGNNAGDVITRKDAAGNNIPVDAQHPLTIEFSSAGGRPAKYDDAVNPPLDNLPTLQNAPALNIIWDANATAAAPQDINLDLGKVGTNLGIICVAGPFFPTGQQIDGVAYGVFDGIFINEAGVVTAKFDNGETLPVYKIPLVLFADPNSLQPRSGNLYTPTNDSGNYVIRHAKTGGAGTLVPSALEGTTVELAEEYAKLIEIESAYSANAKVISTSRDLLQILDKMKGF